jgi:hypothetical protein
MDKRIVYVIFADVKRLLKKYFRKAQQECGLRRSHFLGLGFYEAFE